MRCEGVSTQWNVCVGFCYGVINRPKLEAVNTRFGAVGDDVERSIRYMVQDGIVLHYRTLTADTRYREGEGGLLGRI